MSGTASRFQGRFGYGPALGVGQYLPQTFGQTLPAPAPPPAPAAPAPAPAQPAATPVSAGSTAPGVQEDPSASGPDGGASSMGLGASPGTLGGGLSGFGVSGYGGLGSTLGGLAGIATGVPGLGLAGNAIGTTADVMNANGQLAELGFAPSLGLTAGLSAGLNNATFGYLGESLQSQMAGIPGYAGTVGMGAMGRGLDAEQSMIGPIGEPGPLSAAPEQAAPLAAADYGGFATAADNAAADAQGSGYGGYGATDSSDFGGYGGESQFMSGGYTGAGADGEVQPDQPAGTVHEGEQVLNAQATAYYGLPLLNALNNMEIPRSRLMELARG